MTARIVTPGRARAVLAVLALVGCGEDDGSRASGSTPPPEADLTVEAHDIDFDRDEYKLTPGVRGDRQATSTVAPEAQPSR